MINRIGDAQWRSLGPDYFMVDIMNFKILVMLSAFNLRSPLYLPTPNTISGNSVLDQP